MDEARRATRSGRALIGWMAPDAAHSILVSGPADAVAAPAHVERALAARAAVAARSPGIDQRDVVFELPDCVAAHVDGLRAQPLIAPYFASGWEPRMVDLTRLCAVQPHIHTEDAEQRVAGLEANDLRAIAAISLPKPDHSQIPVQYDAARSTWIFSARNQNLRVVSQFQGQVQPGTVGFGFVVGVVPSVFQVASFQERYLLRDGYHRAYGLLRRGITHVPAFVRAFATLQELALTPAMLPHEAFLGDRPPVLADYLDDAVTADVELPAFQKMIVIQALELTPMA